MCVQLGLCIEMTSDMGSRVCVCVGPDGTGLRTTGRTFMLFNAELFFNMEGYAKPVFLCSCSPY
jgi:hypothetical protein